MIPVNKDLISRIVYYEPSDKSLSKAENQQATLSNEMLGQLYSIFASQTSRDVNIDLFDLGTILNCSGKAFLGLAEAKGPDRALHAITKALQRTDDQVQETTESKMALLSVTSGKNKALEMDELTEMTEYLQEHLGHQTEVIFGHSESAKLNDEVRVMVVVSGNPI